MSGACPLVIEVHQRGPPSLLDAQKQDAFARGQDTARLVEDEFPLLDQLEDMDQQDADKGVFLERQPLQVGPHE